MMLDTSNNLNYSIWCGLFLLVFRMLSRFEVTSASIVHPDLYNTGKVLAGSYDTNVGCSSYYIEMSYNTIC